MSQKYTLIVILVINPLDSPLVSQYHLVMVDPIKSMGQQDNISYLFVSPLLFSLPLKIVKYNMLHLSISLLQHTLLLLWGFADLQVKSFVLANIFLSNLALSQCLRDYVTANSNNPTIIFFPILSIFISLENHLLSATQKLLDGGFCHRFTKSAIISEILSILAYVGRESYNFRCA